jgi:hypothetical protein
MPLSDDLDPAYAEARQAIALSGCLAAEKGRSRGA